MVKIDQRVHEIWSGHVSNSRLNPLTVTLSLGSVVMYSAHHLTKRNI